MLQPPLPLSFPAISCEPNFSLPSFFQFFRKFNPTAMAMARFTVLKSTAGEIGSILGFRRWIQSVAQSPPLAGIIDNGVQSSQPVLPELSSPSSYLGGSMELMAVPKKRISKHKRGIRNGPKALKPTPVIVLCKTKVAMQLCLKKQNLVESSPPSPNEELWPCQAPTLLLLWWRTEQSY
ncbi:hypothetical protein PIB30_034829 [Stylosanthes scabra]|uniref:Large ribosomal subunit protein bL32m n=1 Tax=Stylosanthes scabra TaxID=79078 RepID=A0ABU6WDV0_9FABA|nr:hypothetical protein [Stylosanthes scabra]